MARKSRKNVQSFELEREIRVWKTAVYARLSRSRKELESIETQIEEVKNYIKIRPYFKFVDVYADDGYTGTDFKRPEFLRLMEDLRNRKIDCIIVRDLSRFARNHIEADEYLCNIFPFLGVRFIAIMDSYDNINVKPKEYFLTSFKNFAHAYFAMETSRKVCTAKRNLQEQGKFIGSRPPLGYRKDPADKHKLIVDEEKAPIIREIFERYADGEAIGDIASDFNRRSLKTVENFEWDYSAIHAILQKEAYLGTLIQRTTVKAFYKCQETTRIPKDEQLRFENAFPPIISRELWERVRQIQASPKVYPTFAPVCKNVYKFLVYCGHCKHNISGRNQKRKSKPTYLSYSCRYCKPAVSATAELIDTAVRNHLKLPTDTEISRDLVLQNFISHQNDLKGAEIVKFCDDGFSGMNTERDAFSVLLGLVRERKVDVLAVKDFSRLGRSSLDVMTLVDSVFPFMGVRLIAVADDYDSKYRKRNVLDLDVAFKIILNEFHVTDLSEKSRKSFAQRTRNGKFYGNIAYGYTVSADLKVVQVDEEKSEIVREMFTSYANGKTTLEIARSLNEREISTSRHKQWTASTVRRVLTNSQYIGIKIGLALRRNLKTKQWVKTPKSEHYVNQSAFPPIVSEELFNKVQELLPKTSGKDTSDKHVMAWKLYCGHCKKSLYRRDNFGCSNGHKTGGKPCFEGTLKPNIFYPIVLAKIKSVIGAELAKYKSRFSYSDRQKLETEIARLKVKRANIFEDYVEKRLSESEFARQKETIANDLERCQAALDELCRTKAFYSKNGGAERPVETLKRLFAAEELTKEHMLFVERIDVFSAFEYDIIMESDSPLTVLCKNISLHGEV